MRSPFRALLFAAVAAAGTGFGGCSDDSGAASTAPKPDASAVETDSGTADTADTSSAEPDTVETPDPDVPVEPPTPTYEGSFAPDEPSPTGASIVAEVDASAGASVTVRVRARGLADVLGVAFRLQFDPQVLQYASGEASDALSDAAAKGYAMASESKPGEIVYGHARFSPPSDHWYAPPELSGAAIDDAVLLTLTLDVVAAGTSPITFAPLSRDVRDSASEQIPVTWSGGTLSLTEADPQGGTP
jgi:hypothetical protein